MKLPPQLSTLLHGHGAIIQPSDSLQVLQLALNVTNFMLNMERITQNSVNFTISQQRSFLPQSLVQTCPAGPWDIPTNPPFMISAGADGKMSDVGPLVQVSWNSCFIESLFNFNHN